MLRWYRLVSKVVVVSIVALVVAIVLQFITVWDLLSLDKAPV